MSDDTILQRCFPLIQEIIITQNPGPDRPLKAREIGPLLLDHPDVLPDVKNYQGALRSPQAYAGKLVAWYRQARTQHLTKTVQPPARLTGPLPTSKESIARAALRPVPGATGSRTVQPIRTIKRSSKPAAPTLHGTQYGIRIVRL